MQFFIGSSQLFGNSLAIADVANRAQHERSVLRDHWTETDLYGELSSVATSTGEIDIRTHPSGLGRLREILAVMVVLVPITLGDKHFDLLTDQFVTLIAEQLLGLRIDLNDGSITIDGNDGIRKSLQEIPGKESFHRRFG